MEGINEILSSISNSVTSIGSVLVSIFNNTGDFFYYIVNVFKYIAYVFKTLFYGLTSLLTGISDSIGYVFTGGLFVYIADGFDYFSTFIGGPATVFFSSLLIVVIFRIIVAFVFKIFRLNLDYKKYTK